MPSEKFCEIPQNTEYQTKNLYLVQWPKCKEIMKYQRRVIQECESSRTCESTAPGQEKNTPAIMVYACNETEAHKLAVIAMLPLIEQQRCYYKVVVEKGDGEIESRMAWLDSIRNFVEILQENGPPIHKIELEQGFFM